MRKEAMELLLKHTGEDFSLAACQINPLLNVCSPHSNVQPVLAMLSELITPELSYDSKEIVHSDVYEGLRVLLNLCSETLEAQEELYEIVQQLREHDNVKSISSSG